MKSRYKWKGTPVKVKFGYCVVSKNEEKPLCWYNYECSLDDFNYSIIPAVKILGEEDFCISNHFGIGIHKLLNGGMDNYKHFLLPVGDFSENSKTCFCYFKELDLDGYSEHEAGREKWWSINLFWRNYVS
jgi:hypothetical protein